MNMYNVIYSSDGDGATRSADPVDTRVAAVFASYGLIVHRSKVVEAERRVQAVVEMTRPIDLPVIEHALRSTGRRLLRLAPVAGPELTAG